MNLTEHLRTYSWPLRQTTLGIIRRSDEVNLAMKKRGFGVGKWNFPGGKNEPGELPEQCIIRETVQEFGTTIRQLKLVAILYFYFVDVPSEKGWDQKCYVFEALEWEGEPTESDEMAPRWWGITGLPYHEMWPADEHWIKPVLRGEVVTGQFLFTKEQSCLEYKIVAGQIIDQ